MSNLSKIILLAFSILFFSGCATKITVKSLHPSKIKDEKIHTVFVDRFFNDNINQTSQIEERLSSAYIKNKKLFRLKTNSFNTDAIITGEVLESSLNYHIYYEEEFNKKRCLTYEVDKKTKKRTCIQYIKKLIPCEKRDYKVKTKIDIIKTSANEILFSKVYTKTKFEDECYRHKSYPYYSDFHRNKKSINSNLAKSIAQNFLQDISPHYNYYTIEVIDEITSLELTNQQKDKFDEILELIENANYSIAKKELENLNKELNFKSWEVLYNLGLIYEKFENLKTAQDLYLEARQNSIDNESLAIIQASLNRVNRNLSEKIKAISQLP
ncbi:tetratricopeptide repeat protein [Arcobacter roscoffensis]|uniref:Tetratricopeptide repeat protein n=1 Tax=Arcobacter roscoffensis TaxID=2961520 RepID=A0ABY5E197_9BACT|nr:hypothetical protein [Arcobacter roscoffensis]UTJ05319.1 hypothetical protein NJU99_08565 [Arcobacter roscoffensis]